MNEDKVEAFVAPPEPELPSLSGVFELLRLAPAEAENLFCRIAKGTVSRGLSHTHWELDADLSSTLGIAHPTWVAQLSICLCITQEPDENEGYLEDLMNDMIWFIKQNGGQNCVLIGALSARIHSLGKNFFNFVLSQKFTREWQPEERIAREINSKT